MTDENEDFSLRKLMEQGEGGAIGEPYHVQTIFEGGKVRLDLPEVAATYYAELVAERVRLAEALEEALTVGYFGDAQEAHSRLWDVLSTTQETDR